ncbi:MAG: ribosome-associated translation inhibitor RaiA [Planctomycetes bacterium]|nr:ribosome-associated translation inhibitor RaiA [Planctomycetota bacterium]
MNLPFELRQKNVELPAAMAGEIRTRAERLDHFFNRIMRCRVSVEGPGDLTVPGAQIVVQKQSAANLELALKAAFDAASRRLEDHVRRTRGFVKTHAP